MPAVGPLAPLPGHGDEPDAQTAGHGLTRVLSFRSPSGRRDQMTAFIGRREVITLLGGAASAWPVRAWAQQQAMPIIAVLGGALNNAEGQARIKAFTEALQDLSWIEGRNIRLDIRLAGDDLGRIRSHAAELGHISPAAILAIGTPVLVALREVTRT